MNRHSIGLVVALFALILGAGPSWAAEEEVVTLPLTQYLELVAQGRAAREAVRQLKAPVPHELSAHRVRLRLDGDDATFETSFEVTLRGDGAPPLSLPVAGWVERGEVIPAAAGTLARSPSGNELFLLASGRGKAEVRLTSRVRLAAGKEEVTLATLATPARGAAVVELSVDLPAALTWDLPHSVVLDQGLDAAALRRRLRLAPERGSDGVLKLRRQGAPPAAQPPAVARAVVVTHLDLRAEEVVRLDTLLFEVLRGELGRIEVPLPPGGLGGEIERAWMDDGGEVTLGADRLIAQRKERLRGRGFLKVLSRSRGTGTTRLALAPLTPDTPVRARYLVVSAAVAATLAPQPEGAWSPIDLTAPPDALAAELAQRPPAAGWRLEGDAEAAGLTIERLPAIRPEAAPVLSRSTTTLVNLDGTVLVQDRFRLAAEAKVLPLSFPAGTKFESATVDGDVVRPIEREGQHLLTIPPQVGPAERLVVVSFTDQPLPLAPSGRRAETRRFALPVVASDVLVHEWQLHLPPGVVGRWVGGALRRIAPPPPPPPPPRPAPARGRRDVSERREEKDKREQQHAAWSVDEVVPTAPDPWATLQNQPGVLVDRVNVGGAEGVQSNFIGPGTAIEVRTPSLRPHPGGTSWQLAGALPSPAVTLDLEVKVVKPRKGR